MAKDGSNLPDISILIDSLDLCMKLYRELLDVVRQERLCVAKVDVQDIREVTFVKEALVHDIAQTDSMRQQWLSEASDYFNENFEDFTLSKVAEYYDQAQRDRLLQMKDSLLLIVQKVQAMSEDNSRLVRSALKDASAMKQNVLGVTADMSKVYGPKGQIDMTKDRGARIIVKDA